MSIWFVLASGPSQCQEDIDAVRGKGTVLAINNQLFAAPWADLFYTFDAAWFREYADPAKWPRKAEVIRKYRGQRWSADPGAAEFGCRLARVESGEGLGRLAIHDGCNSGYHAINLAYLLGATTIVLLGYDMQHTGGRIHNHEDHPRTLGNFWPGEPELCRRKFPALAADLRNEGINVINCTRETALMCFPRLPLSKVLAVP